MSLSGRMFAMSRPQARNAPWGSGSRAYGDEDPVGLTAAACAVRLVSETLGSFVVRPYTGDGMRRQPVFDAVQAATLQDGAPGYSTSMDLWSDVTASVELCRNGFIGKGRDGSGIVRELYAWPSEAMCVFVDAQGRKSIEARVGSERIDVTRDVIHVRGWSPVASVSGTSPGQLHQRTIRGAVALEQFRGRYFDNDSTPNVVLSHPGDLTKPQRDDMRESWDARHGGVDGESTAIVWGGITVQQLTQNLEQSQVAELAAQDVLSIARMFRIYPPALLAAAIEGSLPTAENLSVLFFRFSLLHRLRRIERALSADRELFNDRKLYARFDVNEFVRGDTATTANKLHQLRQGGLMTANEGRAELDLPPSTDPKADELLTTPVGAAPNKGNA